ncbi:MULTISPECIES: hypothetical protein [Pseudomonas]|uniref:Uncharacterized protein n=2 Tax=Pseudomonas TaxID=286 RepID=A0AAX1VRP6_PSEAJ|nr:MULTISPECIES: hypothetical protein [Pseudomonas]MEE4914957.1 hypothetical protein [Pseudomonas alliivorans]ELQ09042.1 hypothetical protein A988_19351 [Pseudomonas syringae BRIP39023]KEZ26363.1 hypothetical protein A3SK_0116155 [Pseudomonas amygdali pv. tabaci str. 6605]KPY78947.1 hypothetical protein ALO60_102161 [Pseudomonas amygdali pv. tabaci]MCK9706364.1 hypothetical protein [Pseudomonas syringae pv. syringae]
MQPETFLRYIDMPKLAETVRAVCARLDVKIRPQTDFAKALKLASEAECIASTGPSIELGRAQRVLLAIEACQHEPELREPLRRIASNPLDPASLMHSPGKDAVFELEMLQYVRHRQLVGRLGEPDVVVSAPFGDYYVACKTINSIKNFEGQIRAGCDQVVERGHGCIAFNLEPHLLIPQPIQVQSEARLRQMIHPCLESLYKEHQRFVDARLKDGRLDGVLFQISCFAEIADSHSDMDVFTHTVFYCRSHMQERAAIDRFEGFRQSMQGPMRHVWP